MISCQQREAARAKTLPQLQAVGIEPEVFLSPCSPAGPRSNAEVSFRALSSVDGPVLFLEDDIDVSEALPYYLRLAEEKGAVTYFYVHDDIQYINHTYGPSLTKMVMTGMAIEPGLYPVWIAQRLFHAQAVFLPRHVLAKLDIFQMKVRGLSIDAWLTRWIKRSGHQAYVALPHPVGHRHDRTARHKTNEKLYKFSRTFGQ
jgi:hypothetical protein